MELQVDSTFPLTCRHSSHSLAREVEVLRALPEGSSLHEGYMYSVAGSRDGACYLELGNRAFVEF